MTCRFFVLVVGVLAVTEPVCAQSGAGFESQGVGIFNAVMKFRLGFMGDSTRVASCLAYRVLGQPGDFASAIPREYSRHMDRDPAICTRGDSTTVSATSSIVTMDSVAITDSTAILHATVFRAEFVHRQHYSLRSQMLGRRRIWTVSRVVLDGATHVYPGRIGAVRPPRR